MCILVSQGSILNLRSRYHNCRPVRATSLRRARRACAPSPSPSTPPTGLTTCCASPRVADDRGTVEKAALRTAAPPAELISAAARSWRASWSAELARVERAAEIVSGVTARVSFARGRGCLVSRPSLGRLSAVIGRASALRGPIARSPMLPRTGCCGARYARAPARSPMPPCVWIFVRHAPLFMLLSVVRLSGRTCVRARAAQARRQRHSRR